MKVELRKISDIIPYENNPRHNDAAVDAVAKSINEFGFRQPVVVDAADVITVGHTRWKAAQKLGLKEIPVHVATDLTPAQIRAYRIADNQSSNIADWDYDLLPLELAELELADFDLDLLGFSPDELAQIMGENLTEGLVDPDEIPAPPDAATTQAGDLWVLGEHRLLCGDSSKPEDLDRLLDGAVIDLVNTDPPYNVRVEPRSYNAIAAGNSSFAAPKTHHHKFELERHPSREGQADAEEAAGQGPAAGERLYLRRGVRRDALGLVRQRFTSAEAWRVVLHLGRLCQPRQLPGTAEGVGPLLQPSRRLEQDAPRADSQRLYGGVRDLLLRLEGRRRPQVLRSQQRDRSVAPQEGDPAVDGPSHRETGRARRQGDPVLVPPWRERPRPVWRQRLDAHRVRADGATGISDRTRRAVLRRHRRPLRAVFRKEGGAPLSGCSLITSRHPDSPSGLIPYLND